MLLPQPWKTGIRFCRSGAKDGGAGGLDLKARFVAQRFHVRHVFIGHILGLADFLHPAPYEHVRVFGDEHALGLARFDGARSTVRIPAV